MPRKPKKKQAENVPTLLSLDELYERLATEFCPPIDDTVLRALLSDYPTPTTADETTLRRTLLELSSGVFDDVEDVGCSTAPSSVAKEATSSLSEALDSLSQTGKQGLTPPDDGDSDDSSFNFLMSLFPSIPMSEVCLRLEEAGGDVGKATELLLSYELLESGGSPLGSSTKFSSSSSSPSNKSTPPSSVGSRDTFPKSPTAKSVRKEPKAKATTTISLTSTPRMSRSNSAQNSRPSSAASILNLAAPSPNMWVSLDSTAHHLAHLLQVPVSGILSHFHKNPHTSPAGHINDFVKDLASQRPDRTSLEYSSFFSLLELEEEVDRERGKLALRATSGSTGEAMDLLDMMKESDLLPPSKPVSLGSSPDLPAPSSQVPAPSPSHLLDVIPPPVRQEEESLLYSVDDCEAFIEEYMEKRKEALLAATKHFKKGKHSVGEGGAALYWGQQARFYGDKISLWQERRARELIRSRRIHDPHTIDLHGLALKEAKIVVLEGCNTWWSAPHPRGTSERQPLRIITGVGRHSKGNNPVLLPNIRKMLVLAGWKLKDAEKGKPSNDGALVVIGVTR
ncbi:hypothetical protein T439DRAFT_320233 [Meredithblackwellia eburnea MCA 4105]